MTTRSLAALQSPRYTLRNAARVLGVSRSTLQRSLTSAHIVAQIDPMDRRCRWLTRVQLLRLAQLRGVVLLDAGNAMERLVQLEIKMAEQGQRLADIGRQLEEIEKCLVNHR